MSTKKRERPVRSPEGGADTAGVKLSGDFLMKSAFILLLFVSVGFRWRFPLLGGSRLVIYVSDILYAAATVYVLFQLAKRKFTIGAYARASVLFAILLLLYFLFVLALRYSQHKDISGSVMLIRPALLPVVFYLLMANGKTFRAAAITVLALCLSIANLAQLAIALFVTYDVRSSRILSNVNVYNCIAGAAAIFWLILYYHAGQVSIKPWIVRTASLINLSVSLLLVLCSGSRVFPMVFAVILLAFIVVSIGRHLRKTIVLCVSLVAVAAVLAVLYSTNAMNARQNLQRTFTFLKASDPVEVNRGDYSEQLRTKLWKASLAELGEDPLFGVGDINIKVTVNTVDSQGNLSSREVTQAPHDFVLEGLVAFGIIGLLPFVLLLFSPFVSMCASPGLAWRGMLCVCLLYFSIFVPSLFEPLITTKQDVALIFWILLSFIPLFYAKVEAGEQDG